MFSAKTLALSAVASLALLTGCNQTTMGRINFGDLFNTGQQQQFFEAQATPAAAQPAKPAVQVPSAERIERVMDEQWVATKSGNVRRSSDTRLAPIGELKAGQAVRVTGKVAGKDWYRIEYRGVEAYVAGILIAPPKAAAAVPAAVQPAKPLPPTSSSTVSADPAISAGREAAHEVAVPISPAPKPKVEAAVEAPGAPQPPAVKKLEPVGEEEMPKPVAVPARSAEKGVVIPLKDVAPGFAAEMERQKELEKPKVNSDL